MLARLARVLGLMAVVAACSRAPVAVAGVPGRPAAVPRNGLEVIGAMRWAHPSRALRSLAFNVTRVEYRGEDSSIARARVHALLPGRLRVETLPASRRTGYVRNQQRLAVFERGRRVASAARPDLTAMLAYDVFAQGIDTTILRLDETRMRYAPMRPDAFQGRPVWVVGAERGDTTTPQFWVDASRWRVLRVIQRDPRAPARLEDVRFTHDTTLLGVPVPTRVAIYRSGRLAERQILTDFVANPRVPARVFDLSTWRALND